MYFLSQPLKFVIVLFAPLKLQILLKFVITKLRLKGNLAPAGGTVRWDMLCRLIGYSSQAAKNGIGYRNQRAILG